MMQRSEPSPICSIHRTLVVEHQLDHRKGACRGRAVERELAAFVFYAGACFVRDEDAGGGEVVFGDGEVEGCLCGGGVGGVRFGVGLVVMADE